MPVEVAVFTVSVVAAFVTIAIRLA